MNLPNRLSLMRICLVPFFIAAYFLPFSWGAFVAVGIFIVAAATDFLDGYIARKYNLVTDLGKLLDPIADKILVCAALFCVVATNPLQFIFNAENATWGAKFSLILLAVGATVIISRELLISAVRQIAASKGVVVQANVFGKIKTIVQDVSLPMLVTCNFVAFKSTDYTSSVVFEVELFWKIWWWASVVLFGVAVVLTILSGVIYMVQNKKVFTD